MKFAFIDAEKTLYSITPMCFLFARWVLRLVRASPVSPCSR